MNTNTVEAQQPEHTGATPLLVVDRITLRFGGVTAINGVSFDVFPRELFAIIGPNDAGKTSILNCLNAVYQPQEGSITIDGVELIGQKPPFTVTHGIGRTFQNIGLFKNLDVVSNLMLGRHHLMKRRLSPPASCSAVRAKNQEIRHRRRVEEVMRLMDLHVYRGQPVGVLPYGVQKRMELARALCMEPKLLLLDEPVAGMNATETEDMARYMLEIKEELRDLDDPDRARHAHGDGRRGPDDGGRLRAEDRRGPARRTSR